jgi:hypothetical protein
MTISLGKSYELIDMQKQLISSIWKKNERLTTQIVFLQESEATLKALVGPGAAKGAGRSAASKKRKRAKRGVVSGGALTAAERRCQHRAALCS